MGLFNALWRGTVPAETGEPVYVEPEEVPVDLEVGSEGDNSELHQQFADLVSAEQVAAHEAEEAVDPDGDGP